MQSFDYTTLLRSIDLQLDDVRLLDTTALAERRIGAKDYATNVKQWILSEFESTKTLYQNSEINEKKAIGHLVETALETTSFLYAVGATHRVWKRWCSLTAAGMLMLENTHQAVLYAAISGDWKLLHQSPTYILNSKQVSDQVLCTLLTDAVIPDLPEETEDEFDQAWLQLLHSIPSQNHTLTEDSLKTIADFWMGEDDNGDWINFHPHSYPDFDSPACAITALARKYGYQPINLTDEQYNYLEAGLV